MKKIIGTSFLGLLVCMLIGLCCNFVFARNEFQPNAELKNETVAVDGLEQTSVFYPESYGNGKDFGVALVLAGRDWKESDVSRLAMYANYFAARGQIAILGTVGGTPFEQPQQIEKALSWIQKNALSYKADASKTVIFAEQSALNAAVNCLETKNETVLGVVSLRGIVDTNSRSGYAYTDRFLGVDGFVLNAQNRINANLPPMLMFASSAEKFNAELPESSDAERDMKYNVNRFESQKRFVLDTKRYGAEAQLISYKNAPTEFYLYSQENKNYVADLLKRTDEFLTKIGLPNTTGIQAPTGDKISSKTYRGGEYSEAKVQSQKDGRVVLNVNDYEVYGDSVSNTSDAIAKVFQQAVEAGGGTIYFPKGEYYIDRLIKVRAPKIRLNIIGDGEGLTVLRQENYDGVFFFESETAESSVTMKNFTVLCGRQNCGTAIEYRLPESDGEGQTLFMKNVEIQSGSTAAYNYGYRMLNQHNPEFENVIFSGAYGFGTAGFNPSEAAQYFSQIGFDLTGSSAPKFSYCYSWSANIGYNLANLKSGGKFAFYNSFAVSDRQGIYATAAEGEKNVCGIIDAGHYNCRDYGFRLNGLSSVNLFNCLMYNDDYEDVADTYNDINLQNCENIIISETIFHQVGNIRRTNIIVGKDTKNVLIRSNYFNSFGNGICVEEGAKSVYVLDNMFTAQSDGYEIKGDVTKESGNVVY